MLEVSTEEVEVSTVRPGDLVENYRGTYYIKNIYRANGDVSPHVQQVFGQCVTLEYTDDKSKCNSSYTEPEPEYKLTPLDHSVETPSIYPLKSKITRVNK